MDRSSNDDLVPVDVVSVGFRTSVLDVDGDEGLAGLDGWGGRRKDR